jgi:hypothetical protein
MLFNRESRSIRGERSIESKCIRSTVTITDYVDGDEFREGAGFQDTVGCGRAGVEVGAEVLTLGLAGGDDVGDDEGGVVRRTDGPLVGTKRRGTRLRTHRKRLILVLSSLP